MSGHTPGPWHIGPGDKRIGSHYVNDASGRVIAEVYGGRADTAALLAAAPALAEALRDLYSLRSLIQRADGPEDDGVDAVLEAACAALAAAEVQP